MDKYLVALYLQKVFTIIEPSIEYEISNWFDSQQMDYVKACLRERMYAQHKRESFMAYIWMLSVVIHYMEMEEEKNCWNNFTALNPVRG